MAKRFSKLLMLSLWLPSIGTASAQTPSTTFDVFLNGVRMGTEISTVQSQPGPDGQSFSLKSEVVVRGGISTLTIEVSFDADWQPIQVQFTTTGPLPSRSWMQFGRRKITFRSITQGGELARELPRPGRFITLHDAVPSLYSALLHIDPGELNVIEPGNANITRGTLVDHGLEDTRRENVVAGVLHHFELQLPEGARHAWFGTDGSLMLVEIPSRGVRAVRR